MAANGRLPASDLADIPGGRLRKDAAASWLRMRQRTPSGPAAVTYATSVGGKAVAGSATGQPALRGKV